VFPGDCEMAACYRALDRDATLLGPVKRWAPALSTAVRPLLDTPAAACRSCGPEYVLLTPTRTAARDRQVVCRIPPRSSLRTACRHFAQPSGRG
jgi:hypothetical protein